MPGAITEADCFLLHAQVKVTKESSDTWMYCLRR